MLPPATPTLEMRRRLQGFRPGPSSIVALCPNWGNLHDSSKDSGPPKRVLDALFSGWSP